MPAEASPWKIAVDNPDKIALLMADTGESVTYGEMVSRANRLANHFLAEGLREGDTVAFFLENQPRYLELVWAAKIAGLFYVCISRQLNSADVSYILANSGTRILITSRVMSAVASEAVAALPAGTLTALMMNGTVPGFGSYEDAIQLQPDTMPSGRCRGNSMLYSSGTTGRPKGVRFPMADASPHLPPGRHDFLLAEYGFGLDTVLVNPGPYYHASPLRIMMHAMREGATVIGFAKFDALPVLKAIETHRATHAILVPTMFSRMLALPNDVRGSIDVSSMRYAIHQAAPCPVSVKEAMIAWWGPVLYELYGGSEGNGTTQINSHEWLAHKGSVGRPSKGIEVHVVDENGQECPPNTPGLIYLGNGRAFEYFGEPDKTASIRHPKGWSTLGDIGYLDADGYLYLTDRQSNMIISGGVNIYPQEAENILAAHPDILDVAVIGVPNADFGEEVKAVVVAKGPRRQGAAADDLAAGILRFCRERLSAYKCPRTVDFVDALPRSEAGKLLKRELRKAYWPDQAVLPA